MEAAFAACSDEGRTVWRKLRGMRAIVVAECGEGGEAGGCDYLDICGSLKTAGEVTRGAADKRA
jgi:hypothetical protein